MASSPKRLWVYKLPNVWYLGIIIVTAHIINIINIMASSPWYWWFLWVYKLPQVSREAAPYPSPARQEACQTCAPEGKKWAPRYFMIFHDISSSVQMGEVQWQLQSSIYRRVRCFPIEILVFITAHKEVKLRKVTATPNGFVSNIDEAYRPTQNAVVYVYHHFSMVTKPYKSPAYYSVGPNITACHHFFRVPPID